MNPSNAYLDKDQMSPQVMTPPPQGGFSPLTGNYYQLRIKWTCKQSCDYGCGGQAWFELNESADATFQMLKTVGGIKQFHQISWTGSDPYQATLLLNNQPFGTSQRLAVCGAPECEWDQVFLRFTNGAPLGNLRAKGDCSMKVHVLNPQQGVMYRVETECCDNKCCSQEFRTYNNQGQIVGKYIFDDCQCGEFIAINVEIPFDAVPQARVLLIFTAHYLIARIIEQQQGNNGYH